MKFFVLISQFVVFSAFGQFAQYETLILNPCATPIGSVSHDLKIIDWNNDGLNDIFFSNYEGGQLNWYENLGSGQFSQANDLGFWFPTVNFEFIDFNNDSLLDLVFQGYYSYPNGDLQIRENVGGTLNFFSTTFYSGYGGQIKPGDFDNDGDQDFIFKITGYGYLVLYRNEGGFNFSQDTLVQTTNLGSFDIGDLTGNGFLDIIYSAYDSAYVIENIDGINFNPIHHGVHQMESLRILTLNDADENGDLDVSYIGEYGNLGNVVTFLNNNTLDNWIQWNHPSLSVINGYLVSGDMNNDGIKDLIAIEEQDDYFNIDYYEKDTGLSYIPHTILQNFLLPGYSDEVDIELFDFDKDGDLDIVGFSKQLNEIFWLENLHYSPLRIYGELFYDFNENGLKDTNDLGIPMKKIWTSGQHAYSKSNGEYFLNVNPGIYAVYPDSIAGFHITSQIDTIVDTLSLFNTISYNNDFGFYPDSIFTSINGCVLFEDAVCNNSSNFWLNVTNEGTTIENLVLKFTLDSSISYIASSIPEDSISGNSVYWHFDSLMFTQSEQITLEVFMPNFQSMGDSLSSTLSIYVEDTLGNLNSCYSETIWQVLLCSYDPNNKHVSPQGLSSGNIIHDFDHLSYQIQFQNTGNFPAQHVLIIDTLSSEFNASTFELLGASHPVQVNMIQGNIVHFYFENIFLPDSSSNETQSHGIVKFRVKPDSSIISGTHLLNTANIYFDQNPAIVTNTTDNEYFSCDDLDLSLSVNDSSIFLNQSFGSFQWIDCEIQNDLLGENSFEYYPLVSGTYAVEVEMGLCIDTSVCVSVGINGSILSFGNNVNIFPNPTSKELIIQNNSSFEYSFEIVNSSGQSLLKDNLQQFGILIMDLELQSGIYYIILYNEENKEIRKIIISGG
ncbi:MAG: T9SS type A sorting domain-containing protein [Crocinitomicaceae bacterium]